MEWEHAATESNAIASGSDEAALKRVAGRRAWYTDAIESSSD
jgi:hypothetical protein